MQIGPTFLEDQSLLKDAPFDPGITIAWYYFKERKKQASIVMIIKRTQKSFNTREQVRWNIQQNTTYILKTIFIFIDMEFHDKFFKEQVYDIINIKIQRRLKCALIAHLVSISEWENCNWFSSSLVTWIL